LPPETARVNGVREGQPDAVVEHEYDSLGRLSSDKCTCGQDMECWKEYVYDPDCTFAGRTTPVNIVGKIEPILLFAALCALIGGGAAWLRNSLVRRGWVRAPLLHVGRWALTGAVAAMVWDVLWRLIPFPRGR
jgi:hypothetical protein